MYENLQKIIRNLKETLNFDTPIEENLYFKLVGDYSKELNLILGTYFESDEKTQTLMRPFLNYFRQLQHYLVFIIRYPTILQVPHHSEILQALNFIEQQESLIKEQYNDFSKHQKEFLTGEFRRILENFLQLKYKKSLK